MQGRFNFTGKLQFNKEDSKNPWLRTGKTKAGKSYQTFGAAIVAATNNRSYIELFGQKVDKIKAKDNDGNDVEFDWDDRLDESVISSIRNKQVIRIGDERHEFVTPWDLIEFVKDNKDKFENKTVCVTGRINKNVYNGTISDRFQINNIYVVDEDTKPALTITEEIFFNADSIDTADWKEEKKIYINGYTEAYVEGSNQMVPRQMILNCSKLDFENEKHLKLLKFRLDNIGCEYVDGKIKCNLKKGYYSNLFTITYQNGAERQEFTVDMLTPMQKLKYDMAEEDEKERVLNSFRPAGDVYGARVTQYLMKDVPLTGNYSEGMVKSEDTESEFEEKIYVPGVASESAEDVLDKKETKKTVVEDDEEDDDLFS